MASESETLDISSLRSAQNYAASDLHKRPGMHSASAQPAYNPLMADAARQRIEAAPDHAVLPHPDAVPATPTSNLITSRDRLVREGHKPATVKKRKLPSAFAPMV